MYGVTPTNVAWRAGVFQSGMVSAYASWQVFSALLNHPDDRCHLMDVSSLSRSTHPLARSASLDTRSTHPR